MKPTRRAFICQAAGNYLSTLGMTAKSYGNIIGANNRYRVGVVGFSD